MATRTPLGTLANGHVVDDDELNSLPRGEIGYVEVTGTQGSITSEVDITSLTLTVTLSSARRYRWKYVGEFLSTVADGAYVAKITDSSNNQLARDTGPANTASQRLAVEYEENGSGASTTRKVRLSRATGSGTYTHSGASSNPARLSVEDIGPAFT